MTRRALCMLLALALVVSLLPGIQQQASAATKSSYAPYAYIEYGYSSTVTCGTVRYVSQVSSDSYFYPPTGPAVPSAITLAPVWSAALPVSPWPCPTSA